MIRHAIPKDKREELINELLNQTPAENRCSFLNQDECGLYCSKNLRPNEKIIEQRRNVCDIYSLQLWCLDKNRAKKCIWYLGEKFD